MKNLYQKYEELLAQIVALRETVNKFCDDVTDIRDDDNTTGDDFDIYDRAVECLDDAVEALRTAEQEVTCAQGYIPEGTVIYFKE